MVLRSARGQKRSRPPPPRLRSCTYTYSSSFRSHQVGGAGPGTRGCASAPDEVVRTSGQAAASSVVAAVSGPSRRAQRAPRACTRPRVIGVVVGPRTRPRSATTVSGGCRGRPRLPGARVVTRAPRLGRARPIVAGSVAARTHTAQGLRGELTEGTCRAVPRGGVLRPEPIAPRGVAGMRAAVGGGDGARAFLGRAPRAGWVR